ncbi:hypothetical protein Taro_035037 [Colocasia esculenta]|uniref:Uncharacterized protein n=1 Tax=Colocasia esculenta TaxID=4460 RepID=A0A843VXZ3_COLES|nr:hypothetical protein [Colocasia esculenta]
MCLGKFCLLFLLSSQANISQLGVDARPITVPNQEKNIMRLITTPSHYRRSSLQSDAERNSTRRRQTGYVKVFESLGMMCECCDGAGGECKSKWNSPCSNLKCRPWKFL